MLTGRWQCNKCGKSGNFNYARWESITDTTDQAVKKHQESSPSCEPVGEEFQIEWAEQLEGASKEDE